MTVADTSSSEARAALLRHAPASSPRSGALGPLIPATCLPTNPNLHFTTDEPRSPVPRSAAGTTPGAGSAAGFWIGTRAVE
jgi:hypothetical protein